MSYLHVLCIPIGPGLIKSIYKEKASEEDVDNYKGISLLNCMGNLFTAVFK